MPFEIIPKQTIDINNANGMLDIYRRFFMIMNDLNNFISTCEHYQLLNFEDIADLLEIETETGNAFCHLAKLIDNYLERKGITEIVNKERGFPNDI